jgi:hypothetical protein
MTLVREPDAGKPPVRFDEREVETEHGMWIMRHRRGNPDTDLCQSLPHRATSRLYTNSMPRGHAGRERCEALLDVSAVWACA